MEDEYENLRTRRKKTTMSLSCCFHGHNRFDSFESTSSPTIRSPRFRSPSNWIRSKTHYYLHETTRPKRRSLMSCICLHRRHSSADFSYDPSSYALNFEDPDELPESEDVPIKNFAARLPASPPRMRTLDDGQNKVIGDLPSNLPRGIKGSLSSDELKTWTSSHNSTTTTADHIAGRRALAVAEVRKSLEEGGKQTLEISNF